MMHNLPTRNEHRIRRADGTTVWVLVQTVAERDSGGRILGYVGAMTDITPQKELEEALRVSEEQFRLLFRENPIPMWVYDRETLFFLEVNDSAVRRYGWSREEFLRRKITDIRPPEDIPLLLKSLQERPPGWYRTDLWRHRLKDGTIVSVDIAAHASRFNGRDAVLVAVYTPDQLTSIIPVVEAVSAPPAEPTNN
jgi:PAS domain S-box-containing protein